MNNFINEKNNFENIEKNYKIKLENREKEIIQLQARLAILKKCNKSSSSSEVKRMHINNSSKNKTSKSNINYNQDETFNSKNHKNENNSISNIKNEANFNLISNNIKQKTMKNNQNNLSMNNINDNISLYYKYLNYDKYNSVRKSLDKNNSAPNIHLYNTNNSSNANRKKFISNYLKKINNNYFNNPNSSSSTNILSKNCDFNFLTKDNSFNHTNNLKKSNNNYTSKNNLKKLPSNNPNNTFNINKNKANINLTTSLLGENINIEKYKEKQKLSEYQKFIDKKIVELMKDKKTKIDLDNNRLYSPKTKKFRKISKVMSSSDFGRNKKSEKSGKFANTNYKNINNDNKKNFPDKITIIPKRIQDCEPKIYFNSLIAKDINKTKLKKIPKNPNVKGKIYLDSYNEMMNKKNIY